MLPGFLRALWGDLSPKEVKKFALLSLIIAVILGNYWMLRSLKNPIFNDLVGIRSQPFAKMASMFVVAFVIAIYSKLVDIFSKETLFYIIGGFYALVFFFLAYAYANQESFSLSETSALMPYFKWIPGKLIGWLSYFAFESSSLLIILFWAFVASITKPESAKKGYAMIVTCTQVGTIIGPLVSANFSESLGLPALVAIGGAMVCIVPFLVKFYNKTIPAEEIEVKADASQAKKPKTGFFEGIRLIFSKPYVMGILIISTVYEIIATVLEFQMNVIASDVFNNPALYAKFTSYYGVSINCITLIFALVGTSFFMRKYGLRFCLIAYPTVIGLVLLSVLTLNFSGAEAPKIMWVLYGSMIAVKGLSYALNNPTKEVMYIPTTKDIRYKAKGWIESFGGRSAKGIGATITSSFAKNLSGLLLYGTIISLGVVGAWLVAANWLGKKYNELQKNNITVE